MYPRNNLRFAARPLLAAVLVIGAGACGGEAKYAGSDGTTTTAGSADEAASELRGAERDLEASLGLPEGGLAELEGSPPAPPPAPPPPMAPGQAPVPAEQPGRPWSEPPASPLKRGDAETRHDACQRSCRALASMDRAAARLCTLTNDGDARCLGARERLVRARRLVRERCPGCPSAS